MAKYAANTAWVLLIDKVSFSLGVPPPCQAYRNRSKKKRQRMRDVHWVLSLFDQSKLFVRPSSTFRETIPQDKGGRGKSQCVCTES